MEPAKSNIFLFDCFCGKTLNNGRPIGFLLSHLHDLFFWISFDCLTDWLSKQKVYPTDDWYCATFEGKKTVSVFQGMPLNWVIWTWALKATSLDTFSYNVVFLPLTHSLTQGKTFSQTFMYLIKTSTRIIYMIFMSVTMAGRVGIWNLIRFCTFSTVNCIFLS